MLNLVHGDKEAVDAILDSPLVKGVTFVGSTPVGKYIYARCGETGKRAIVQAGAKNFLTVMPDAEIDRSTGNMMASFFGCTGQRCLAGANLMAVGDIYEELKEKFVAAAAALKVGPGLDESVNMGPIISKKSLERVHNYIDMAVKQGAKVLLDGRDVVVPGYEGGFYIGPTVLDNVTPEMTHAKEEIFGPVASIIRVKDMEESIKITNASPVRQRRLHLHHQRPQRAQLLVQGAGRQHRREPGHRRRHGLLPVRRPEGLLLRHHARPGQGRGAVLHRFQGRHHPLVESGSRPAKETNVAHTLPGDRGLRIGLPLRPRGRGGLRRSGRRRRRAGPRRGLPCQARGARSARIATASRS